MKNTVSKLKDQNGLVIDDEYVYRGVQFQRYDNLRGYSGHYRTFGVSRISTMTRKQMVCDIDLFLKAKIN